MGKEALLLIQNEKYRAEFCYLSWLARCRIMTNEPGQAWETYVRMETGNESLNLLHLIANDCYKMGHFYYASRRSMSWSDWIPIPNFGRVSAGRPSAFFRKSSPEKSAPTSCRRSSACSAPRT